MSSDGTPITATHVQMTLARLFRLGASMAADIDYLASARQFKASHKIRLQRESARPEPAATTPNASYLIHFQDQGTCFIGQSSLYEAHLIAILRINSVF
jgi:hypothetical protein